MPFYFTAIAKHYIDQELVRKAGQRLRQIRESRQLLQDIVDMDIDVNCSRIERGRSNITISTLSKLCTYYGIGLDEFFRGL